MKKNYSNLYQEDYIESCNKVAEERKKMIENLSQIEGITVFNSQANYIMCKLESMNSKVVATKLLCDYNIFIKDLSSKDGFKDGQFMRLAVRNSYDNELLLKSLKEIFK